MNDRTAKISLHINTQTTDQYQRTMHTPALNTRLRVHAYLLAFGWELARLVGGPG